MVEPEEADFKLESFVDQMLKIKTEQFFQNQASRPSFIVESVCKFFAVANKRRKKLGYPVLPTPTVPDIHRYIENNSALGALFDDGLIVDGNVFISPKIDLIKRQFGGGAPLVRVKRSRSDERRISVWSTDLRSFVEFVRLDLSDNTRQPLKPSSEDKNRFADDRKRQRQIVKSLEEARKLRLAERKILAERLRRKRWH